VVASDTSEEFPVPDGGTREYLREFGIFPVFLVNRNLDIKATSTAELYPFKSPERKKHKGHVHHKHVPKQADVAEESALRIYR
jgi:hypothetical protein